MMTGETIWADLGVMDMSPSPFGPQAAADDVNQSRFDTAGGWDQAVTMDRAPVDHAVQPLSALASPPGLPVRVDSVYLDLERNQGNPSDVMTPTFRYTSIGDRFDSPLALIDWAQETAVIPTGGELSLVRDDVQPTIPKELYQGYTHGFFGVIDGQALLDEAIARTRRALYGR